MVIQFLCPNGHKIHCDAQRAGLAAKCPKCGVKFRVPAMDELAPAGTDDDTSPPQSTATEEAPAVSSSGLQRGPATAADQIEFLCPNNHLLHGPAKLQGSPEQCPECGSRFRVPSPDEVSGEDKPHAEGVIVSPSGSHISIPLEEPGRGNDIHLLGLHADHDEAPTALRVAQLGQAATAMAAHPLFDLFCRLWPLKARGATIEVRYGDGQRLSPDRFGQNLSAGSHAVFAVDEPNGTHTMTAVAWDAVNVVVIRGARTLPEEMGQ